MIVSRRGAPRSGQTGAREGLRPLLRPSIDVKRRELVLDPERQLLQPSHAGEDRQRPFQLVVEIVL